MSSNRQALLIAGALLQGPLLSGLVEAARAEGTQVVFVGTVDGVTPRFPDWVITASASEPFSGSNLAAQLRAVGISRLQVAGPEMV
ncbi:MAG: hypothetical protein JF615_01065, partial [Asticcacaulis sp.]|nr:hypothetical protein [Asticcacaulis sp.]